MIFDVLFDAVRGIRSYQAPDDCWHEPAKEEIEKVVQQMFAIRCWMDADYIGGTVEAFLAMPVSALIARGGTPDTDSGTIGELIDRQRLEERKKITGW